MGEGNAKRIIGEILSPAGVTLNGGKPWNIQVRDERFYRRVLRGGSLGLGESYMDRWWECEDLAEFICRIIPANLEEQIRKNWKTLFFMARSVLLNPGRKTKAAISSGTGANSKRFMTRDFIACGSTTFRSLPAHSDPAISTSGRSFSLGRASGADTAGFEGEEPVGT